METFFKSRQEMAETNSPRYWLSGENFDLFGIRQSDFPEMGGMNALEVFCNDIRTNLVEWSYMGNDIFYRTQKFWYHAELIPLPKGSKSFPIVTISRHRTGTTERLDTWCNLPSFNLGRAWLIPSQENKRKRLV